VAASNNFIAGVTLINKELKNKYPQPRQQWSTEQFEAATNELEAILNLLTRRYKGYQWQKGETPSLLAISTGTPEPHTAGRQRRATVAISPCLGRAVLPHSEDG
jgi:hypothetical protein